MKESRFMISSAKDPMVLEARCPDGTFDGRWGGYSVTWNVNGIEWQATTEVGIRGLNIKCKVTVSSGAIIVKTSAEPGEL